MQLVLGRIGKAHGVHGDVAVEVRTDDPERRFAPGSVLDTEPGDAGPLEVRAARPHSGRLLVHFAGVDDRTSAEALRGVLLVADSATCAAPEDPEEFWDHDLVGLAAYTAAGARLGTVSEVAHPPGTDLLVIATEDDRELYVPFVAAIVPQVDLAGGRVVVDPPPGLLEL